MTVPWLRRFRTAHESDLVHGLALHLWPLHDPRVQRYPRCCRSWKSWPQYAHFHLLPLILKEHEVLILRLRVPLQASPQQKSILRHYYLLIDPTLPDAIAHWLRSLFDLCSGRARVFLEHAIRREHVQDNYL